MKKTETVVLLVRVEKLEVPEQVSSLPFKDIPPDNWAAPFIKAAVDHKILVARQRLNGEQPVSRGELALLLSRLPSVQVRISALENGVEES